MPKRKVLIAVHQLNLGGAQKALISALNAIDYSENDVTLYIRKDRVDLIDSVNINVSDIIINKDNTKYYRKPYTAFLELLIRINKVFKRDTEKIIQKQVEYIEKQQYRFEYAHYFSNNKKYDLAISYIQGNTAEFVQKYVNADRKVMFFHTSTDDHHELHEQIMKGFDRIICVSPGALEAVKGFYPQYADKMSCIENYVDADEIRRNADEYDPDYPKNKLILCSCGRMTSVKGFDLAVESAKILKEKDLDFKWFFVGDGPDRGKIEQLISDYQLTDFITITGLQQNPYPYIKHCDIYVQPSYEESQGLTIVESQILLRPIVSTATIGAKSMINDGINGLLSKINPLSLSERTLRLANSRNLRSLYAKELSKKDYQEDHTRFCRQWSDLLDN